MQNPNDENKPQLPMNNLGQKAVEIAISKIGMKEQGGANMGPIVEWSMKPWTKAKVGAWAEWCCAFVCTCLYEAGLPIKKVASTNVKTLWENCERSKLAWISYNTPTQRMPIPGDIVFFVGLGHVGICEKVEGRVVHTIEGNFGDQVRRDHHDMAEGHFHGFAHVGN